MPWRELSIMEQRQEFVVLATAEGDEGGIVAIAVRSAVQSVGVEVLA